MIRATGMNSGLDTDAIIQELVSANSKKKEKLEKSQTKLEWKQDAWKTLNKKIKSFYTTSLSNMRYASAYKKKKTESTNEKVATVAAGDNAVNGSQSLVVKKLAKAGYLTGAKLGKDTTASTTLSDLTGGKIAEGETVSIAVGSGGKTKNIELSGKSTINDVVKQLNSAGVSASYDASNQRIFISAQGSGKAGDFTLTSGDMGGLEALSGLGLLSAEDAKASVTQEMKDLAAHYDGSGVIGDISSLLENSETKIAAKLQSSLGNLSSADEKAKNAKILNDYYSSKYADELNGIAGDTYDDKLTTIDELITEKTAAGEDTSDLETQKELLTKMKDNEALVNADGVSPDATAYSAEEGIAARANAEVTSKIKGAYELVNNSSSYVSPSGKDGAVRIQGEDAEILLNGASFTSTTNNFSINGLTITAKSVSAVTGQDEEGHDIYEETQITTADDVSAIFDTVKNFIKSYNDLIKEIDSLFGAENAKGYEPLTDEEKDAMSDKEIEKWEEKIKGSLLRHDDDLGSVQSILKNGMQGSFIIGGVRMSLSSFGIETGGYFESEEFEKGVFHIDGDPDDELVSGKTDKLKSMIAKDPKAVTDFFTQLTDSIYESMRKISSTSLNRSFGNFYDDKVLTSQFSDYKTKISKETERLNTLEDRYYKQFASMETALSKVNSTSSYITGMFGM